MGAPRQTYHLEPPRGLMNDPNGLCFFSGRYYAFFQWNRFAKDHSHKEWGYFTSPDLVHWGFQGSALLPDQPYDQSGVHSGSAVVKDSELLLFYTGSDKSHGRRSSQCLATSRDGHTFVKQGIVVETPNGYTQHFRDPKVWRAADGDYGMVVGAQRTNGKAAIALLASKDARDWRLVGNLGTSDAFEMTECPDLFELGGSTVLTYCPQHRDNAADTCGESHAEYQVLDETLSASESLFQMAHLLPRSFVPLSLDHGQRIDLGFDFYAPQSFLAPDGRRIMLAWMSRLEGEQERLLGEDSPSLHCLTLPRELSLRNGRLVQRPVHELYDLLGPEAQAEHDGDTLRFGHLASDAFCLRLSNVTGLLSFKIRLHAGAATVSFDAPTGTLALTRTDWVSGKPESRTTQLDSLTTLELWSDESSLEIFANDGEAVFSARVLPQGESREVIVERLSTSASPAESELFSRTTNVHLQEVGRTQGPIVQ